MIEPKPCPFCGWGTIVDGGFLNHKCTCNACGASTKGYPTWELAIEAWNKRAEPSRPQAEMIQESYYSDKLVCSNCGIDARWDYEFCPYCGYKFEQTGGADGKKSLK